jgi:hypothetical protein
MSTPTKRTEGRKRAILKALSGGHGYISAAAACGIGYSLFKEWRRDDPEFARACEDAREYSVDLVEHRMFADAMAGVTLAQLAILRARRPELYHRKMLVAVGGDPDAPPVAIAPADAANAWIFPRVEFERRDDAPTIEADADMIDVPDDGGNESEAA